MNALQTFSYQDFPIEFEKIGDDLYANATAMCRPFGKTAYEWGRLPGTIRYVDALKANRENPVSLTLSRKGGTDGGGATWIHEKLILKLAQWLDVDFEVWCDQKVSQLLRTGSVGLTALPQTHSQALRALAAEIEAHELTQLQLEAARPKIDHYEAVMNAEGYYSINSVAKMIGTGEVRLFRFLRDQKILFHDGQANKPFQQYLELDWFVVKQNRVHVGGNDRVYVQTYATQHGIEAIRKKWLAVQSLPVAPLLP